MDVRIILEVIHPGEPAKLFDVLQFGPMAFVEDMLSVLGGSIELARQTETRKESV